MVLNIAEKLGEVYKTMGKLADAEVMFQRVYEAADAGAMDQHAASDAAYNLAVILAQQGHDKKAEPLYKAAIEGYMECLGHDDPSTLDAVFNLAACVEAQGQLREAAMLLEVFIEAWQRLYPADDELLPLAKAKLERCLLEQEAQASSNVRLGRQISDRSAAGDRTFALHKRMTRGTPGSSRALSRDE